MRDWFLDNLDLRIADLDRSISTIKELHSLKKSDIEKLLNKEFEIKSKIDEIKKQLGASFDKLDKGCSDVEQCQNKLSIIVDKYTKQHESIQGVQYSYEATLIKQKEIEAEKKEVLEAKEEELLEVSRKKIEADKKSLEMTQSINKLQNKLDKEKELLKEYNDVLTTIEDTLAECNSKVEQCTQSRIFSALADQDQAEAPEPVTEVVESVTEAVVDADADADVYVIDDVSKESDIVEDLKLTGLDILKIMNNMFYSYKHKDLYQKAVTLRDNINEDGHNFQSSDLESFIEKTKMISGLTNDSEEKCFKAQKHNIAYCHAGINGKIETSDVANKFLGKFIDKSTSQKTKEEFIAPLKDSKIEYEVAMSVLGGYGVDDNLKAGQLKKIVNDFCKDDANSQFSGDVGADLCELAAGNDQVFYDYFSC